MDIYVQEHLVYYTNTRRRRCYCKFSMRPNELPPSNLIVALPLLCSMGIETRYDSTCDTLVCYRWYVCRMLSSD